MGIFQIIKDIKDEGIKINDDDEAITEIREHIQNLRNKGIKDNRPLEIEDSVNISLIVGINNFM